MTPAEIKALVERLEWEPGDCPFCGRDPYHYVDNGVGMERVAVTCCDEGIALLQHGDDVLSEQVTLRREAATALRSFMDGGWRPIETAPRGGSEFQAWWRGTWQPRARFDPEYGSFQLWGRTDYDTEGWEVFPIDGYWMPAPTPPAVEGEAGE